MRSIAVFAASCCAMLPAWAGQDAAPIPFKREAASAPWSGAGLALILVSLIAVAAVLLVRKRLGLAPAAAPRMLRILESQRVGPRVLLSVVEYKGEHYLLSCSEQGVTCLVPPRAEDKA